jgi:hypothetical protein
MDARSLDDRVRPYLDDQGRVTRWPTRRSRKDQIVVLRYLASKFAPGEVYSESQVNDILRKYHTFEDWAMLRREMFEAGLINRETDGSRYWVTPKTKIY